MGFCPIQTAIELVTKDFPLLKNKYKLEDPVSTLQKAKLTMWIGDKMHSSLRSESITVIESLGEEQKSGVLQIHLPAKQNRDDATMRIPIEKAVDICRAEDPLED
jgi:hypothetical protein